MIWEFMDVKAEIMRYAIWADAILSRPQESSFSNVFVISSVGMNSSEGVRNLFPIVKYGRAWSANALSIAKVRFKFWKR